MAATVFVPRESWPWPLIFWPQNKRVCRTAVEHIYVKFIDPRCSGFWDIVRKNRQTHRQTPTSLETLPRDYRQLCKMFIQLSVGNLGWKVRQTQMTADTWTLSGGLQRQPGLSCSIETQRFEPPNWNCIKRGFTSSRPPSCCSTRTTFYECTGN